MKLQNILAVLIENATIVETETEILIVYYDRLVTPEGSSDVPIDEIQDSVSDMAMPVSLLTRSLPVTTDQTQSVRVAFSGLLGIFILLSIFTKFIPIFSNYYFLYFQKP